jgi:IclR family acetate operon transcriptional repressor
VRGNNGCPSAILVRRYCPGDRNTPYVLPKGKRTDVTTDTRGTETAARVADVLLLFIDGPQTLGVSAIARTLGLSKTVVHRTLTSLAERGLVSNDQRTREYHLGPTAAALGARALRDSELRGAALAVMRDLQKVTGETVTVSARVPHGRVYLDQVASTEEIKMTVEVGRRFPLHAGSSSTCILAFMGPEEIEALLSEELIRLTPRTITDAAALRLRLSDVRRDGLAHSDGERQAGASSVAAPVFGVDGEVVGAVSICGPAARFDAAARMSDVPLLRVAADTISRRLGWRGGLPERDGSAR